MAKAKAPSWLWPAVAFAVAFGALLLLVNYLFSQTGTAITGAVKAVTDSVGAAVDRVADPVQGATAAAQAQVDAYADNFGWTAVENVFNGDLWAEAWDTLTGDDS